MSNRTHQLLDKIYKDESGRILAMLLRVLGDLDLAEEALQEAFAAAMSQWPRDGIPMNPRAWLVSVGKFKAIDTIRRNSKGRELLALSYEMDSAIFDHETDYTKYLIEDDYLRLIFYCCHPLLSTEARIALSLREVCGLSTGEIARAFLVPEETIKKRISRAKTSIKQLNITFDLPDKAHIEERLNSVSQVIYLIFNEGYSATTGEVLIRRELTTQAIFLARRLVALAVTPESLGLLALLLLQESRRDARLSSNGNIIPLEEQDRSLWDQDMIFEGICLLQQALMSGRLGPYTLQAAIASVHAQARSVETTQWRLIVDYYDMLLRIIPSPVVELNRAIAIGMKEGCAAALTIIEHLLHNKNLSNYHTVYAAYANFLQKSGKTQEAVEAYQRALELVRQAPEKRYLENQLAKIL